MNFTTYLLAVALMVTTHAGHAQKIISGMQPAKRSTLSLAKNVPAKIPLRTAKPLTGGVAVPTILTDSSRKRSVENRIAFGLQTKPALLNAATGLVKLTGEEPNRVQIANPQLMSELNIKPYLMPLDKASVRGSYPLGISATKTTHIIFPSKIREFDAGTDYVLAQVPESVSNVLRVKANDKSDFCTPGSTVETNMTIITDDGNFYSFIVRHQADPEVLNINIANNLLADEQSAKAQGIQRTTAVPVMLTAAPANERTPSRAQVSDTELRHDCERIYERKRFIRRVGASKGQISSHLTGLYVNGKVMYLQLTFQNDRDIDYDVNFVKFYLRDRDVLKRMAAQEIELTPYLTYPTNLKTIKANTNYKTVYSLPLRTLSDDKVLEIELYERDGGRHLRFRIESGVMLKSKGV